MPLYHKPHTMPDHIDETGVQRDRTAQALRWVSFNGLDFQNGDPSARQKLIANAHELFNAAQTPVESLLWNTWALPTRTAALRIAVDLRIFETTTSDNGSHKTTLPRALLLL
jgi:hypothetical protein